MESLDHGKFKLWFPQHSKSLISTVSDPMMKDIDTINYKGFTSYNPYESKFDNFHETQAPILMMNVDYLVEFVDSTSTMLNNNHTFEYNVRDALRVNPYASRIYPSLPGDYKIYTTIPVNSSLKIPYVIAIYAKLYNDFDDVKNTKIFGEKCIYRALQKLNYNISNHAIIGFSRTNIKENGFDVNRIHGLLHKFSRLNRQRTIILGD